MNRIPQSKEEITLRHHFVHYTFIPMIIVMFIGVLSPLVLWSLGYISMKFALAIPWISLTLPCLYIAFLGEYVIPSETYLKVRSGEWGCNNEQ